MKWVDLTDALFCRAFEHTFVIYKQPRMGVKDWAVIAHDGNRVVAEGTTATMTKAKSHCKIFYDTLRKQFKENNVLYRKSTGKLVKRKRVDGNKH